MSVLRFATIFCDSCGEVYRADPMPSTGIAARAQARRDGWTSYASDRCPECIRTGRQLYSTAKQHLPKPMVAILRPSTKRRPDRRANLTGKFTR